MLKGVIVALLLTAVVAAAPADAPSGLKSTSLVRQLTAALTEQKLDAIAAKDPDTPDRFVAALYYPGSQLLVFAAKAADPTLLDTRLFYKQYHDIYVDLQGRPVAGSSLFIQDMKADGLPDAANDTPDIVYRADGSTMVFDGGWKKRGMTEAEYRRQLDEVDGDYARLLMLLMAQLKPT